MSFPSSLSNLGTASTGTTQLSDSTYDHSARHNADDVAINNLELFLGTNAATNVFGAYVANELPLGEISGVLQKGIAGTINLYGNGTNSGTLTNNGLITGGSVNATAGSFTNGSIQTGTLGTANVNVGTIGTLAGGSLTTNNFQTGQFLRPLDNTQNWKMQYGTFSGTLSSVTTLSQEISFPAAFATKILLAGIVINSTTTNPISQYVGQAYSLTAGSMNSEIRYIPGNTTDTLTIGWWAIGY